MNRSNIKTSLGLVLLAVASAAAQNIPVPAVTGAADFEDRMVTPAPVGGQSYSTDFAAETRANYLRGGVTFTTAYSDNVLAGTTGTAVSDISYSVWPTIALDKTTSRLHLELGYAPGFTIYQKTPLNEADHNLAFGLGYRLSPHVTVNFRDSFQKTTNGFNQPDQGTAGGVSGSTLGTGGFIYSPIADRLTNVADVGISYQFSPRSMVGASGNFAYLHYPTPAQVQGQLYDTNSEAGSVFYNMRIGRKHYAGVSYQYDHLVAEPSFGNMQTNSHAVLLFYSLHPTSGLSLSAFGGPQYSETTQLALPSTHSTTPGFGGSVNYQAHRTALAASYSHLVSGGGGLIGAARTDTAAASLRQEIARHLVASFLASYANRNVLVLVGGSNPSGHTVSGSVSVERQFGTHLSVQAGYTRLHQTYTIVPAISVHPDTNREWLGISYTFTRALGR